MTTSNWITLLSALIVAVGWFVNGFLNRRKDIAQKRMEHRLNALESFLPIWFSMQKTRAFDINQLPQLETCRTNFHLYGKKMRLKNLKL